MSDSDFIVHAVLDQKCTDCTQRGHDIAEEAVRKVFATIGVDIDSPESIEAFREDLRFNKSLRKYTRQMAIAAIGLLLTAFAASLIDLLRLSGKGIFP
jgi:hypothetical protein